MARIRDVDRLDLAQIAALKQQLFGIGRPPKPSTALELFLRHELRGRVLEAFEVLRQPLRRSRHADHPQIAIAYERDLRPIG